jgi:predicted ferric reductase
MRLTACLKAAFLLPLPFGLFSISIGRFLALAAYTNTISALLLSVDAPKFSAHFADDIAFRAAWITVMQVPLVYLLATKRGPLQVLTGLSYEQINWLHRWVGRILFLCATVHMAVMMSSISVSEMITSYDKGFLVVRYGAGAYGTLLWLVVSSVLPLRQWNYKVFYINHWLCMLVFLGMAAKHVPPYAPLPIYSSLAVLAIDKCISAYRLVWDNISMQIMKRKFGDTMNGLSRQVLAMGHLVKMMPPVVKNGSIPTVESTTIIRLSDVSFAWKPGQHVRLYLPKIEALEIHPFTPATCSDISSLFSSSKIHDVELEHLLQDESDAPTNEMVLMVRSHSGLTKRLSEYHSEWLSTPCPNASRESSSLTAYIDGPYGNPPTWEDYENVVLIATSTGVSYILSILDYLEQLCYHEPARLQIQQIRFIWANRHIEPQFEGTVTDLVLKNSVVLRESGIKILVEVHITCSDSYVQTQSHEIAEYDPFAHLRQPRRRHFTNRRPLRIRNPDNPDDWEDEEEEEEPIKHMEPFVTEVDGRSSCETYVSSTMTYDDDEESLFSFSDLESIIDESEASWWSCIPPL